MADAEHGPEHEPQEPGSQFLRSAAESVFGRIRPRQGGEQSGAEAAEEARTWRRRARATYRRRVRLSLSEIYLQLGAALAREQRFDEATDAFQRALREGGNVGEEDVLEDLMYAADGVKAKDLAFRARLELSLANPARASELLDRAARLVDDDVTASQGRWVLDEWLRRFESRTGDASSRYEVCMLLARVALFTGDDSGAVAWFAHAAAVSPSRARFAARAVLKPEALPSALRAEDERLHRVAPRVYEALGLTARALEEVEAALESPGGYEAEVAMLELKARLLEADGRTANAAQTLFALGRRHDTETEHTAATEAYRRATELNPEDPSFWWYLADSRRLAAAWSASRRIDPGELRRARNELNEGLAKRVPSAEEAWVYWSAALIAEELANQEERPVTLLVKAALDAEQAVALERGHVGPWLLLTHYYATLRAPAAAVCALAEARALDAGDVQVRMSTVLMLGESGVDGALEAIEGFDPHEVDEDWLTGARGVVLLYQHRYEEGLAELEDAVRRMPENAWALGHRALARGLTGDLTRGREDALAVVELIQKAGTVLGSTDARAASALLLDDRAQARALFEPNLDGTWLDPVDARVGLACVEQLDGNFRRAAEVWADAAERVIFPRHVATARIGVDLLERLGAPIDREAWLEPFTRAADRVATRDFGPDEALDEMAAMERDSVRGDARWLMAVAARARTLSSERRWLESAAAYEQLIPFSSPKEQLAFTPARLGMVAALRRDCDEAIQAGEVERVVAGYERLVDLGEAAERQVPLGVAAAHRAVGRLEEALLALEELAAGDRDPDDAVPAAWRMTGEIHLEAGRPEAARLAFERALSTITTDAVEERAVVQSRLAVAAVATGAPDAALRLMREALDTMRTITGRTRAAQTVVRTALEGPAENELPLLPMTMRALIEDREECKGQRRRLTSARFESLRARRYAVAGVVPLVLEADGALFPDGAASPGLTALIEEAIPAMRQRVLADTGVVIPGVRIQASDALSDGEFVVRVRGVPYVGGHVPPGGRLCTAVGACREHGIDGVPLPNAWLGPNAAVWIDSGQVAAALELGLPVLDPYDAMLLALEGLVRVHLHQLVGLAEVDYMVEAWRAQDPDRRSDAVTAALPGQRARIGFAAMVRRIVAGRLSVADLGRLLEIFAAAGANPEAVDAAIAASRSATPAVGVPVLEEAPA
jgi:tetratricopeptide (TPR) repeat protein